MSVVNEYGVIQDVKILDNKNEIHRILFNFLNKSEYSITDLMILQRDYMMDVAGTFSDVIVRRQIEKRKEKQCRL